MKSQLFFAENFVDVRYKSIKNKELRYRHDMRPGTKPTMDTNCRLARGNLQLSGMIGLFSKFKISWFHILVDLKEQSIHREKDIRLQKCAVTK